MFFTKKAALKYCENLVAGLTADAKFQIEKQWDRRFATLTTMEESIRKLTDTKLGNVQNKVDEMVARFEVMVKSLEKAAEPDPALQAQLKASEEKRMKLMSEQAKASDDQRAVQLKHIKSTEEINARQAAAMEKIAEAIEPVGKAIDILTEALDHFSSRFQPTPPPKSAKRKD